jgi:hypothetical protein
MIGFLDNLVETDTTLLYKYGDAKQQRNAAELLDSIVILKCLLCYSSAMLNCLLISGSFPLSVEQLSIFWREKDEDSEWVSPYLASNPSPKFHATYF